ncbi:hypothetical protein OOU_Y34scaffold00050g20 [Pyricularia oryzae Y34]|uniref:Uncharacterized protein n=2 Tax=Pyricularia oryzae TaxID=318829 RepID=A0AA97PA66_PYRO3|nr:hypothetical protein OOU_Y34scaffold00050g20 [Pyricularia oryzae Y34]
MDSDNAENRKAALGLCSNQLRPLVLFVMGNSGSAKTASFQTRDLTHTNLDLPVEHFCSQWCLKRDGSPPTLLKPHQPITTISAKSTAPDLNTARAEGV